jgi:hypothetical protein
VERRDPDEGSGTVGCGDAIDEYQWLLVGRRLAQAAGSGFAAQQFEEVLITRRDDCLTVDHDPVLGIIAGHGKAACGAAAGNHGHGSE